MSGAPRAGPFVPARVTAPRSRPTLWVRFVRTPVAMAGAAIVAAYAVAALMAPIISPHDPSAMTPHSLLAPPGGPYPLGTDQFGRDLLSRLLYGTRVSLTVSVASIACALAGGGGIGVASGHYGGRVDALLMRAMDVVFAFPAVLLAIAIMAAAGTAVWTIIAAIAIVYTPQFARVSRASVLAIRGLEYVEAAAALGAGTRRILARHVLPNISAPVVVQTSLSLSLAILTESALSFLGLGTQPPTPSWGNMLAEARRLMAVAPWTAVFPGAAIALIVLGFNLLGDGLRDLLDPRLRA